jgi:hypothetical protein
MVYRSIFFIFLSLLTEISFSQKGGIFPLLRGESLDGKSVQLPVGNGKFTVVGIAYSRKAEKDLKDWLNPIYSLFIKNEDPGGMDFAEIYDVNFYFIPIIAGFKKVVNDFKRGTDKAFWPYIIDTRDDDMNAVERALKPPSDDIPYFYVIDKAGKIVELQSGSYSEAKLEKIEDAVN